MSHCFGLKCELHDEVIEDDSCPERGCDGHGYTMTVCDDRCPEYRSFAQLLQAAMPPDADFSAEDRPGPEAHAWLDQFLAEHSNVPPEPDGDFLRRFGIAE